MNELLSRVLLLYVSFGLMFGGDYFNKFASHDFSFCLQVAECFDLIKDIVEEKNFDFETEDTKEFISNYIRVDDSLRTGKISLYFLDIKKLYEYCVKNKPDGRYILKFGCGLFVKKDNDGLYKGRYYNNNTYSVYDCTFYIIPRGVLANDKLSVVCTSYCRDNLCYVIKDYDDEFIGSTSALDVQIVNYDEFAKRNKIRELNNFIKFAEEENDEEQVKKYRDELKKIEDGIKVEDDGVAQKDGARETNPTKGSAPMKGSLPPALGKKNNNNTGSSSGSNGKESSSKKCCCCC